MKRIILSFKPIFEKTTLENQYMDTDSFVISFDIDDSVTELKNSQEKHCKFDFSNLRIYPRVYETANEEILHNFLKKT